MKMRVAFLLLFLVSMAMAMDLRKQFRSYYGDEDYKVRVDFMFPSCNNFYYIYQLRSGLLQF